LTQGRGGPLSRGDLFMSTASERDDRAFFGHPRGLGYLAGTELWERFSFYGMKALLMLYMVKYLLLPEREGQVVGLARYRSVLEGMFGPMTDLALAAQSFGLYSGLILLTPLIGAWLGDRVLGRTRTVTLGALLMAAGHLTMAFEQAFLLALLLLILGGGCFIGNLQAQIGQLYAPDDQRRTRAFGLYLIALNVGALVAPLVAGTLGENVGWHWGFGAAGVGMLIGLATYLAGRRHLPPQAAVSRTGRTPLSRAQWITVLGLALIMVPRIFTVAAAQQAYGLVVVWADTSVDRDIFGFQMPVTWILTADGILTILGVVLAGWLWQRMAARGREPSDIRKIGIGWMMVAGAYLFLAALATLPLAPIIGLVVFFLILDLSFAWWSPPYLSTVSRHAPASINGIMMAVASIPGALGNFLLGWLGRFYEPLGPVLYFALLAALPVGGALLLLVFARPMTRLLQTSERDDAVTMEPARAARVIPRAY
jgi:proton-dependent oligopeptide transporter, POT family